jgi:hypothetical protein
VLDSNNEVIALVDDGLAGEGEFITDLALETAGVYTIVVAEFFGEAGQYTLLLEESDSAVVPDLPAVHTPAFLIPVDNGAGSSKIIYFGSANKPFSMK